MFSSQFAPVTFALAAFSFATSALAEPFNLIVPQAPGGGTSVWATVVSEELKPFLGEDIIITHIPGSQDQIGFERFYQQMQDDPMAVMVSHGGNAVSFLDQDVQYRYRDLVSIAQMSNNIVVSRRTDTPAGAVTVFSEQSGSVPEALALGMLVGWDNVRYIKGMNSGDARLAFQRAELNTIRENPLAHAQYIAALVDSGDASLWFHHGLFDGTKFVADPMFPETPTVGELYAQSKSTPVEEDALYPAYSLVTAWRDGLQKALWVHPGNPNRDRLVEAFEAMLADPTARARLDGTLGPYPWRTGEEGASFLVKLCGLITEEALLELVEFNNSVLELQSTYRPQLLSECAP